MQKYRTRTGVQERLATPPVWESSRARITRRLPAHKDEMLEKNLIRKGQKPRHHMSAT
jgi:hypothetical protein